MLNWFTDNNKYEEVHKAFIGSMEITIVAFSTGGYSAWMRNAPSVTNIFKKSYNYTLTIEEVKADFLESLQNYLDEKAQYWSTMSHELWMALWMESDFGEE